MDETSIECQGALLPSPAARITIRSERCRAPTRADPEPLPAPRLRSRIPERPIERDLAQGDRGKQGENVILEDSREHDTRAAALLLAPAVDDEARSEDRLEKVDPHAGNRGQLVETLMHPN
jgi:hypothetical protein